MWETREAAYLYGASLVCIDDHALFRLGYTRPSFEFSFELEGLGTVKETKKGKGKGKKQPQPRGLLVLCLAPCNRPG